MSKRKVKRAKKTLTTLITIIILICSAITYYVVAETPKQNPPTDDLKIYFFDLGNSNAGDCTLIQIGTTEILVDGGSTTNSLNAITNFVDAHLTDSIIEYAIITHAHEDHIACFAGSEKGNSLFDVYNFQTIIDFPKTNSTSQPYNRYKTERDAEVANGAKHYTALDCARTYDLGGGAELEILTNTYYLKSTNENDYSVCFQINYNNEHYLFTGDLEDNAEEYLVKNNSLKQVAFFKAGHHGSYTSSTDALLKVIKPKICVVPCVCGTDEYTKTVSNQYPSQDFINRISKYTTKVYAPSVVADNAKGYTALNGNITILATKDDITVTCSNNNTLLKDTTWFQQNRTMPNAWK